MELPQHNKKEERPKKTLLFWRSVLLLLLFLGIAFSIHWGVGRFVFEDRSKEELVGALQSAESKSKRIAALDWAQQLQDANFRNDSQELNQLRPDSSDVDILLNTLKASQLGGQADSQMLGAVASVLGFAELEKEKVHASLIDYLEARLQKGEDTSVLFAIISVGRLGVLKNREDLELLMRYSARSDPSLRKASYFAFSALTPVLQNYPGIQDSLVAQMEESLGASEEDLRLQALFTLCRWDKISGRVALEKILKEMLQSEAQLSAEQFQVYSQSIHLVAELESLERFLPYVEKTAREHPHIKLRLEAQKALKNATRQE